MMRSVAVDHMQAAQHAGTAGGILGFARPVHSSITSSSGPPPPPPPSAQHWHEAPRREEPSPAASTTREDQQGHSERLETLFHALRELLRPSGPASTRECTTSSANAVNTRKTKNGSSIHRGVTRHRRTQKWEAHIWMQKKQMYLGGFAGEETAGRAHDVVALRTRGPTAILNYPSATYRPVLHLLAQVSGEELVEVLKAISRNPDGEGLLEEPASDILSGCGPMPVVTPAPVHSTAPPPQQQLQQPQESVSPPTSAAAANSALPQDGEQWERPPPAWSTRLQLFTQQQLEVSKHHQRQRKQQAANVQGMWWDEQILCKLEAQTCPPHLLANMPVVHTNGTSKQLQQKFETRTNALGKGKSSTDEKLRTPAHKVHKLKRTLRHLHLPKAGAATAQQSPSAPDATRLNSALDTTMDEAMDVDLAELAAANPTISPRRLDTSKAAASAPNSRFCMPLPTKGSMVTDWKCTKSTAGTTSAPAQPTYPKSMQMQSNETGLSMASATPMLVVGTVSASKVRPAVIDYPTETDSDNPSNPAAAPVQGPHVTFCTAGLSGKRQGSKPHAPHAFGCAASICGSPQSSSAVTAVWSPATSTAAAASCAAPTDLRCSSGTSTCGGGAGCGFPTYGSCSLDITYRRSSESSANYPNTLGDPQQAGAGHGLPELGNDTALPPLGLPSYDLLGSSFRTGDLFCTDMDFPVQDAVLQDAALQDVELMPASSGLVDAIPPLPVAAPWQQEGMTSQPSDAAQAIAAVRETDTMGATVDHQYEVAATAYFTDAANRYCPPLLTIDSCAGESIVTEFSDDLFPASYTSNTPNDGHLCQTSLPEQSLLPQQSQEAAPAATCCSSIDPLRQFTYLC